MLEFGLQGVAYQEVFGPAEATATEALRVLQEKVDRHRKRETSTQHIGLSPHAPYSVSPKLYEGIRDYARGDGLRMTAHIAESIDETLFVRDGAGPFAEAHRKRGIAVDCARMQSHRASGSPGIAGTRHAARSCDRN